MQYGRHNGPFPSSSASIAIFLLSLSLSFRPLIPHPFASLSISFLIPALLELFFFPLFLLESSNSLEDRRRIVKNVKFTRYSMIQLKMEGKNSEEKILRRVNLGFRGGNQSAVATRCGAPASMTSTFLPLLVALLSAIFSQRAHTCVSDTCARVPYPLVEVSPTRCVYASCSPGLVIFHPEN